MIQIDLIGTDGQVWDIRRGEIRLSDAGIRGLLSPVMDVAQRSTALLDGQRPVRWTLKARDVFLPFNLKVSDWRTVSTFLRSLDPTRNAPRGYGLAAIAYCTLRVTDTERGTYRDLAVRFQDDGGYSLRVDPAASLPPMGLTFVADDPWWYGPEAVSNYSQTDSYLPQFFGESGAPAFNIIAPGGYTGIWVINDGDAEAWITFEIEGPATSADFWISQGGETRQTGLYYTLAAGESATIETEPTRQIALKHDGTILNRYMGADFAPIPVDDGGAYVGTRIVGTGRVRARYRVPYKRAF